MGPYATILVFWMLSFKPTFSLSSFNFIKRLFGSSLLSAIRVVSSAYLRLLIFLPIFNFVQNCQIFLQSGCYILYYQQLWWQHLFLFIAVTIWCYVSICNSLMTCDAEHLLMCFFAAVCSVVSDNPMDCSLPVFSVLGIFPARILEWATISFSRCLFAICVY